MLMERVQAMLSEVFGVEVVDEVVPRSDHSLTRQVLELDWSFGIPFSVYSDGKQERSQSSNYHCDERIWSAVLSAGPM